MLQDDSKIGDVILYAAEYNFINIMLTTIPPRRYTESVKNACLFLIMNVDVKYHLGQIS